MLHTLLIVCLLLREKVSVAELKFNSPPPGGATKTIAEDENIGTNLYDLQATDPRGNTPSFRVADVLCVSTPRPSSIPTFTINSLDQLLVPDAGLDAENCSTFRFTFNVTAGGSSVTSDPLTVNVTDVNDNAPQFITPPFNGDVWKNDEAGKIVNENNAISATDPDISNKSITLTISGAQRTFAISDNGSVYVNDKSGLATLASPTVLTIQASDGGLTSTATLEIIVHDDPCSSSPCQNGGSCISFKDNVNCSCQSGYMGIHCENVNYCFAKPCQNNGFCKNLASGYYCTCVKNYINSTINCTKVLRCRERTFDINETNNTTAIDCLQNDFKMYLPDDIEAECNTSDFLLDREITDSLKVQVNVTVEQASVICNVTVNINDINDNAPIFTKNTSDINVCSTVRNGSVLFNVKATDADATEQYNHVSYILRGPDHFTINSQGDVSTIGSLKNVTGPIILTIIATDGLFNTSTQSTIHVQSDVCPDITTTTSTTKRSTTTTFTTTTSTTTTSSTKTPATGSALTRSTDKTTETNTPITATTNRNGGNDENTQDRTRNMIIGLSVAGACAIIILLAMIYLFVHYKRLAQKKKYGQRSRHSEDTTMPMENAKQWKHKRPNQLVAGHSSATHSDFDFQNQQLRMQVPHRHSVYHTTRQSTPDHHYRYTVY